MPATVPKVWVTGETLDAADLNANFAALAAKFSAGLTTADMAASAAIANTQLANHDYEFLVSFGITKYNYGAGGSTTTPVAIVGLPGSTTDGTSYTPISGVAAITDSGTAGNTTFRVQYGKFTGGAWSSTSSIVASTSIAAGGANEMVSSVLTVDTTSLVCTANADYIALFITAAATGAMTQVYDAFNVTLKLKRTDGLR